MYNKNDNKAKYTKDETKQHATHTHEWEWERDRVSNVIAVTTIVDVHVCVWCV